MDRITEEQYIFGKIFKLVNEIQNLGNSVMNEVTIRQFFVLIVIKNMNLSPTITEISEFLGTTRQSTIQMIDALEKKGYLEMKNSMIDKRAKSISLTDKSYDLFSEKEEAGNNFLEKIFKDMETKDIHELHKMITTLLVNVGEI